MRGRLELSLEEVQALTAALLFPAERSVELHGLRQRLLDIQERMLRLQNAREVRR